MAGGALAAGPFGKLRAGFEGNLHQVPQSNYELIASLMRQAVGARA
ncbi:MAG: hypothetical protein HYY03_05565 [Chloroflexi bacterium]|nr:hypothetical protein [Chloroflexota bacterium]